MKAILHRQYGDSDVLRLEDTPPPPLRDAAVLVRVRATSVNPYDWHCMRGKPYIMRLASGLRIPRNPLLGLDFAGEVEAVGSGVDALAPGDAVFGMCDGAFAEYVCPDADDIAKKPATLSFEEAAAVPLAGSTALQGLRDSGRLQAGERILIIGASGGIGTFAVQLAKHFGAHVTGVCSTRNLEFVRSLGADEVLDYTKMDVPDGEHEYDLILQLAGMQSATRCRRALAPRGRLVLSSGDSNGQWIGPIGRILGARILSLFVPQRLVDLNTRRSRQDLQFLARLLEEGTISTQIDRIDSLDALAGAMHDIETGHTRGKIVIRV